MPFFLAWVAIIAVLALVIFASSYLTSLLPLSLASAVLKLSHRM